MAYFLWSEVHTVCETKIKLIFSVSVSSEFSFVHFVVYTFVLTKLHISVLKGSEDGMLYLGLSGL
jgi:hypothetical protein